MEAVGQRSSQHRRGLDQDPSTAGAQCGDPPDGKRCEKYGGCLKATPCFLGVAKSVKGLAVYDAATAGDDVEIVPLLAREMDYILWHNLLSAAVQCTPIVIYWIWFFRLSIS